MSRNFNGTSQYGSVTAGSAPIAGLPFTMMCWFRPTIPVNSPGVWLFTIRLNNSVPDGLFALTIDFATGVFQTAINDFGSAIYAFKQVGSALVANTWYCGVFVSPFSGVRTSYIGTPSGVTSITDNRATTPGTGNVQINIATFDLTAPFYGGLIGEAAAWNIDLSDAEVRALCAGIRPYRVRLGNLKIYYPLWGLASPEPDYSGLKNNVTLTASPPLGNNPPLTLWTPKRSSAFVLPSVVVPPPSAGLGISGLASAEW